MNGGLVISFYNCMPAVPGDCVTVSGNGGSAAFCVDEERLRHTSGLILSVGCLMRRAVRCAVNRSRAAVRRVQRAGRTLIRLVCVMRY